MSHDLKPQLLVTTKEGVKSLQLNQRSTWTIGRSKMNTLPLADRCASRHHAKLEELQDNSYYFVDLNSRNGSLVNGKPVKGPVLLKHGDRIKIGQTDMVFQHNVRTVKCSTPPQPSADVLMVQASATQGKIWQDIFCSQDIAVQWEMSGTDLRQYIALKATARLLPKLLMLDIQALRGDPYELCRWCQQQFPQLSIILMNSKLVKIPGSEYQLALEQGCICLLPALQEAHLLDHVAEIVAQVNLVLQALDNRALRQDKLFLALQALETVLQGPSSPVNSAPKESAGKVDYPPLPDPWEEDDSQELTSLQAGRHAQFPSFPSMGSGKDSH